MSARGNVWGAVKYGTVRYGTHGSVTYGKSRGGMGV